MSANGHFNVGIANRTGLKRKLFSSSTERNETDGNLMANVATAGCPGGLLPRGPIDKPGSYVPEYRIYDVLLLGWILPKPR